MAGRGSAQPGPLLLSVEALPGLRPVGPGAGRILPLAGDELTGRQRLSRRGVHAGRTQPVLGDDGVVEVAEHSLEMGGGPGHFDGRFARPPRPPLRRRSASAWPGCGSRAGPHRPDSAPGRRRPGPGASRGRTPRRGPGRGPDGPDRPGVDGTLEPGKDAAGTAPERQPGALAERAGAAGWRAAPAGTVGWSGGDVAVRPDRGRRAGRRAAPLGRVAPAARVAPAGMAASGRRWWHRSGGGGSGGRGGEAGRGRFVSLARRLERR